MKENKKRQEFLKLMMDTNVNGMSNSKIAKLEKTPEQLNREKEKRQKNKQKNDFKKGLIAAGAAGLSVVSAVGLTTACNNHYEKQNKKQTTYENESNTQQDNNDNILVAMEETENSIIQEVNELNTKEKALRFFKNMYIELHEEKNGESEYTTENIILSDNNYQDYVFVNDITGEYITHGNTPDEVKQKLINDNISFRTEENIEICSISDKDGKIIDSISFKKDTPHKVIIGDQYEESYNSVLVEIGGVFVAILNYADVLENGNEYDIEISKNKLIEELEEHQNARENQKMTEKLQEDMVAQIEEDDFEIE